MSTTTDKKVTRVTTGSYASRIIGTKARRIVVTIMPGDTMVLRLHGTQQREYFSIKEAFETARSRRVLAERMTKINAKRRRK
jgi:hypothetical protein